MKDHPDKFIMRALTKHHKMTQTSKFGISLILIHFLSLAGLRGVNVPEETPETSGPMAFEDTVFFEGARPTGGVGAPFIEGMEYRTRDIPLYTYETCITCDVCEETSDASGESESLTSPPTPSTTPEFDIGFSGPSTDDAGSLANASFHSMIEEPSSASYSRAALEYNSPLGAKIISETTTDLPSGVDVRCRILGPAGVVISYDVDDTEKLGYPVGNRRNARSTITLLNSSGTEVEYDDGHHYVRQNFGDGSWLKYLISSGAPQEYGTGKGAVADLTSLGTNYEIITDSTGIRQVKSPQGLADVVDITNGYKITFYSTPGSKNSSTGYYDSPSGQYAKYEIYQGSGGVNNPVMKKTVGTKTWTQDYTYTASSKKWEMDMGSLRTTTTKTISGTSITIRKKVGSSSTTNSEMVITGTIYDWGEGMTNRKMIVPGSSPEIILWEESFTYTSDGKLSTYTNPLGNVFTYTWGDYGRVTKITAKFLNTGTHELNYSYSSTGIGGETVAISDFRPRKTTEKINTATTAITYFASTIATGEIHEITERATSSSYSYGNTNNIRNKRIYHINTAAGYRKGRIKKVIRDDGTETHYSYALVSSKLEVTAEERNTSGSLVDGESTKSVAIYRIRGQVEQRDFWVYVSSSWKKTGYIKYTYDTAGRVTLVERGSITSTSNSTANEWTTSQTQYTNGEKDWEEDADGIRTERTFDAHGRTSTSTKKGATHASHDNQGDIETEYDWSLYGQAGCGGCEGDVTIDTTGGSLSLSEEIEYDSAGYHEERTDVNGLETTWDSPDYLPTGGYGLKITITRPDDNTEIRLFYKDGRLRSITGTGDVARYYTYTVETGGHITTRERIASSTSSRWSETRRDWAGRVYKQSRSGHGATVTDTHYYSTKGHLIRVAHAPSSLNLEDHVYWYNAMGELQRRAIDVSGNDSVDLSSTDRITESKTYYEVVSSIVWRVSESAIYPTDSSSTRIVTGKTREKLQGLGTTLSGAKLVSYVEHINQSGNVTVTKTYINRSTKVRTVYQDDPDSSNDASQVWFNGLLVEETTPSVSTAIKYGYDALGRFDTIDDPRHTSNATIAYVTGKNQISSTTDAYGTTLTYTYHTSGNGAGQVKSKKVSVGNKYTYYAYTARGELYRIWGHVPYPREYSYTTYGELSTMKTYQSDSGWTSSTWPSSPPTAYTTTWNYDASSGLLTSKVDADSKSVTYDYLADGRLKERVWAAQTSSSQGRVAIYTYHNDTGDLHKREYKLRPSSGSDIDNPDMTDITYTFHRDGALQQVIDAAGTRSFAYDSDRRLSTETFPDLFDDGSDARVLTRKYETSGANKGRYLGFKLGDASDDDADMETSYAFDSYGRFEKIWIGAKTGTADFDYNFIANSDLVAKLTGPATYLQYTYETNLDLPTYLYNKKNSGGTNRATYQVTRNGLGQQTVLKGYGSAFSSKNSIQHDFSYGDHREVIGDLIKRGLSATDTTPTNTTEGTLGYDFDAIGSRDNASYDPGAAGSSGGAKVTNIYTSNNVNEYTSIGGISPSPVHDEDGNLTSMGGVTFKWDGDNRLIEVDTGDEVIEFAYDYWGRRFRKTVTVSGSTQSDVGFIYDGWNLIAEYDLTGTDPTLEKTHYWGRDLSNTMQGAGGVGGLLATELHTGDDDGIYYTGYAPNGNVTEMFDSTGASVAHYEYDAFGQTINSAGSLKDEFTFRFSTKYFDDETDIYYYGFRYYDPETGRWLSRDPLGEQGGLNLYGFVGNDGVNRRDYLGLAEETYDNYEIIPSGHNDLPPEEQLEKNIIGKITITTKLDDLEMSCTGTTPKDCKGNVGLSITFKWENQFSDGMATFGPGKGATERDNLFPAPKMILDGLGGPKRPMRRLSGEVDILWDGKLDEEKQRIGKGSVFTGTIKVDDIPCNDGWSSGKVRLVTNYGQKKETFVIDYSVEIGCCGILKRDEISLRKGKGPPKPPWKLVHTSDEKNN